MASTAKQPSEFYNRYRTANALGEGNFSVVKQCYAKSSPSKKYAVKMIKLKGTKAKKEEVARMMFNEVGVMRKLDHGNIIKCIDAFFGIEEILVVLEYTEVCEISISYLCCAFLVAAFCPRCDKFSFALSYSPPYFIVLFSLLCLNSLFFISFKFLYFDLDLIN